MDIDTYILLCIHRKDNIIIGVYTGTLEEVNINKEIISKYIELGDRELRVEKLIQGLNSDSTAIEITQAYGYLLQE